MLGHDHVDPDRQAHLMPAAPRIALSLVEGDLVNRVLNNIGLGLRPLDPAVARFFASMFSRFR